MDGDPEVVEECVGERQLQVADRWGTGGHDERLGTDPGDLGPRRRDEVVEDAVRAGAGRDASHRVRHVPVKPRKESEAVLSRQIGPPVGPCSRRRDAAGLAAGDMVVLEDADVEAPLGEFVGGGHPPHAATYMAHHVRHCSPPRRGAAQRSPGGRPSTGVSRGRLPSVGRERGTPHQLLSHTRA